MRKQRFRFDTLNHALVLKFDTAMLAIQLVISIIYIGSWYTFLLVRLPRVVWGYTISYCKMRIFKSPRGLCLQKTDWILRLVTMAIYLVVSFGFSVWLSEEFCELIGSEPDTFDSCKWQVFGFRMIFMLLFVPVELLQLAVVYRNATDMVFKIELRKATGVTEVENNRKDDIGYLMDPTVALHRRQ